MNVDYIGTEMTYSIDPLPCDPIIQRYVDGGAKKQFQFAFTSKEQYDEDARINIDNSEFRCFCSKLFDDLLISDWKKSWYSMGNGSFVSWDINVSFEKKHTLSIHGCNSLPYYWQELMDLVKPYFSMIDVDIASFFPSEPQ